MTAINDPRYAAYRVLTEAEENKAYINIALPNILKGSSMVGSDKALCSNIVKGVIERDRTLLYALSFLSSFPVEKIDKRILRLLKTGIYQILFLDKVPPFAVCNETVNIALGFSGKKAAGFLNGVLRSSARRKEELLEKIKNAPEQIRYSVSDDVYQMFVGQYGKERAGSILAAFFRPQPLCIRANTLKTDRKTLKERFEHLAIDTFEAEENGLGFYSGQSEALKIMNETGEYFVQGFSSQRAVSVLEAKSGETVIDLCACPGGKTAGAAIDMENNGSVVSFDIHESKLSLIVEKCDDLGIDIVKTQKKDSAVHIYELEGTADKVICDVPCSGTGSIGKRPEIRYKTRKELDALTETQYKILKNGVSYLKSGGKLVYSVCSLNKNEGERIIERYLENNFDAELVYDTTLFPEKDGYDGFYIAALRRK